MENLKTIIYDFLYVFINYFVAYIPFWTIRKVFYLILGMKLGKGARINMKCSILEPWNIRIGANSIINEFCFIDGRGGLLIGDNCSISVYTIIYTASHKADDDNFSYYEQETIIKDGVWVGARAIILPGAVLNEYCIIGAGCVVPSKEYDKFGVYVGTPAIKVKKRKIKKIKNLHHNMFFR